MTRNPALHRAPLGYEEDGPLTWVAECRVPWEPPGPVRLAIAEWMLAHGSDVHQGGDGPLMRAALNGYRIPMMELLVSHGADVNAMWHGHFPIVFAPCESMGSRGSEMASRSRRQSESLRPAPESAAGQPYPGTALDYLVASYARSAQRLGACIDVSLEAGERPPGRRAACPATRSAAASIAWLSSLTQTPALAATGAFLNSTCGIDRRAPPLASRCERSSTWPRSTATSKRSALLLDRGADVNARATVDDAGIGGADRHLPRRDAIPRSVACR